MGFQLGAGQILVHEKCLRYSNVVAEGTWSENTENYFNVFKTFNSGHNCLVCKKDTATIKCDKCMAYFHYPCAVSSGWDLEQKFLCLQHRPRRSPEPITNGGVQHDLFKPAGAQINHNLFNPSHSNDIQKHVHNLLNPATNQPHIHHNLIMPSNSHHASQPTQSLLSSVKSTFQMQAHNLLNSSASVTASQPNHSLLNPALSMTSSQASSNLINTPITPSNTTMQHNLLNPSIIQTSQPAQNLLNPVISTTANQASFQPSHNLFNPPINNTNQTSSQSVTSQPAPANINVTPSQVKKVIPTQKPNEDNNGVKTFTLDPQVVDPEIGSTFIVFKKLKATRTAHTERWGISLTISHTGNNTTTLRIPLKPPNMPIAPPPYGLLHGDIIIEINGIKLGLPNLSDVTQLQSLMKSVNELRMVVIRKPDIDIADSSLV